MTLPNLLYTAPTGHLDPYTKEGVESLHILYIIGARANCVHGQWLKCSAVKWSTGQASFAMRSSGQDFLTPVAAVTMEFRPLVHCVQALAVCELTVLLIFHPLPFLCSAVRGSYIEIHTKMELRVRVRLKLSSGLDSNAIVFRCGRSKPQTGFLDRLLDEITCLLSEGSSVPVQSSAKLTYEIPACVNNHVFIIFPIASDQDGSCSQTVYGIEVADDSMLTRNEVLGRFHDIFQLRSSSDMKLEVHHVSKQECPVTTSENAYDAFEEKEKSRSKLSS